MLMVPVLVQAGGTAPPTTRLSAVALASRTRLHYFQNDFGRLHVFWHLSQQVHWSPSPLWLAQSCAGLGDALWQPTHVAFSPIANSIEWCVLEVSVLPSLPCQGSAFTGMLRTRLVLPPGIEPGHVGV